MSNPVVTVTTRGRRRSRSVAPVRVTNQASPPPLMVLQPTPPSTRNVRRRSSSRARRSSTSSTSTLTRTPTTQDRANNLLTDFIMSQVNILKDPVVAIMAAAGLILAIGHNDDSANSYISKMFSQIGTSFTTLQPFTEWLTSHDKQVIGLLVIIPMAFSAKRRSDSPLAVSAAVILFTILFPPQHFYFYIFCSVLLRSWLDMVNYQHRLFVVGAFALLLLLTYSSGGGSTQNQRGAPSPPPITPPTPSSPSPSRKSREASCVSDEQYADVTNRFTECVERKNKLMVTKEKLISERDQFQKDSEDFRSRYAALESIRTKFHNNNRLISDFFNKYRDLLEKIKHAMPNAQFTPPTVPQIDTRG